MKILIASPRGFCAGVERAIEIVERALERFGPPVYVRREIVHNHHVVDDLRNRGAIFVDELAQVPAGSVAVFSAHGVSPAVRTDAARRGLRVIDATCPLVAKVHQEALRFAQEEAEILMIGHEGHEEVEGTMGEAPERIRLVTSVADVERLEIPPDRPIAVLTQTTLSVDDTAAIMAAIRQRFPQAETPAKDDICYATQNRQSAVKALAARADLVLVIGSHNSSNSQRLREVAAAVGTRAYLIDDVQHLDPAWLLGVETVAITAGASAPENLVRGLVQHLQARFGATLVDEVPLIAENVHFPLPSDLVQIPS